MSKFNTPPPAQQADKFAESINRRSQSKKKDSARPRLQELDQMALERDIARQMIEVWNEA